MLHLVRRPKAPLRLTLGIMLPIGISISPISTLTMRIKASPGSAKLPLLRAEKSIAPVSRLKAASMM